MKISIVFDIFHLARKNLNVCGCCKLSAELGIFEHRPFVEKLLLVSMKAYWFAPDQTKLLYCTYHITL